MRFGLNKDLGFDEASRTENIRRIGEVSKLFADASCICCTAFISPYRADRAVARELHEKGANLTLMVQADMLGYHVADEPAQLGLPDLCVFILQMQWDGVF